ncbi:hypothetical protein B1R29_24785 [Pseudomonas aeruginosa]|nr:hypothetical protein B1R29_24785 [Pseudomonas aeruginosa]
MHPIEAELIEVVKSGRDWQLEDLGGITKLAPAARSIGNTPMMPELLHPLVLGWSNATAADRDAYKGVLHDLLEVATTDFVLIEAVDILEHHRPLPDDGDECCFMLFLAKAATGEHSLSGYRAAQHLMVRFAGQVTTDVGSFAYWTSSSVLRQATIPSSYAGPPRLSASHFRTGGTRS